MKIWDVLAVSGLLLCCTRPVTGKSCSNVQSDPPASLLATLRKFAKTRNHVTTPKFKEEARNLIYKSFQDFGLHVWSEKVVIQCSEVLFGENIVGILKARRTNTADDKIVIVGAHYDTTKNTTGIDDNGSGVTALLQIAKQIASARCELSNTIMFVAFDFEENQEIGGNDCKYGLLGSGKFVQNLTNHLKRTKGTVDGAFILETMINHNSSAGSQQLPQGIQLVMKDSYEEVKKDSFRGNFIAVVGRRESDKKLLSLMGKHYQNDSDYRAQLLPVPLSGRPTLNPYYINFRDFYRSDHFQFWNNEVSFSALMITDTANFRGYMNTCYHKKCDDLDPVKADDLEFLRRTINAVIPSVLDLTVATDSASTRVYSNLVLFVVTITSLGFIASK